MVKPRVKVALLLFFSVSNISATWQIPDVLIYEEKE